MNEDTFVGSSFLILAVVGGFAFVRWWRRPERYLITDAAVITLVGFAFAIYFGVRDGWGYGLGFLAITAAIDLLALVLARIVVRLRQHSARHNGEAIRFRTE